MEAETAVRVPRYSNTWRSKKRGGRKGRLGNHPAMLVALRIRESARSDPDLEETVMKRAHHPVRRFMVEELTTNLHYRVCLTLQAKLHLGRDNCDRVSVAVDRGT